MHHSTLGYSTENGEHLYSPQNLLDQLNPTLPPRSDRLCTYVAKVLVFKKIIHHTTSVPTTCPETKTTMPSLNFEQDSVPITKGDKDEASVTNTEVQTESDTILIPRPELTYPPPLRFYFAYGSNRNYSFTYSSSFFLLSPSLPTTLSQSSHLSEKNPTLTHPSLPHPNVPPLPNRNLSLIWHPP